MVGPEGCHVIDPCDDQSQPFNTRAIQWSVFILIFAVRWEKNARQKIQLYRAHTLCARQMCGHGNGFFLCRAWFLCRARFVGFVMCCFFAVRISLALPCTFCLPCAVFPFCRALTFAVRFCRSLPCILSLPCVFLSSDGKDFFAVR